MVFGFGKKKTERPVVPAQIDKAIQLDDIPKILNDIESPHIEKAVNIAKSVKEEIETYKKNIHGLILHLESDDLKLDDVDRNLATIVKRGKNSIVSTIKKETSSTLTSVTKYDQVVLLNIEISQMLKKIGDVLGINSRIIHIFAKKYADNLKEEIAKVAKSRNQLQASINFIEGFKSDTRAITETIHKISEYKITLHQKNTRISEIDSEIQFLKNNITNLEKQIQDLRSSDGYNKFIEIQNKINLMSSEKSDIKNVIDLQFSKISRPLGRYSYISSFEKSVKKMMEDLLVNPYDVISLQNKNSIVQILEAVEKSIISGSISVKDSEKALEQVQETISRLDEFISLKETYSKKVTVLENEMTVFDIKMLELKEHELGKTRIDVTNLESIKKKIEEESVNTQQVLTKNISELESSLSRITNSKVLLK